MAKKFNTTQFPFLKLLGMEFNQKEFYKHVFLVDGWSDPDEQKYFRKAQREWYATHRNEFAKDINIWNDNMRIHNVYEDILDAYNSMTEGYEKSGICISSGLDDVAILYTLTVHSEDKLDQLEADGIDHGMIELRMLSAYTSKSNSGKHFMMSALCFLNPKIYYKDANSLLMAMSIIDPKNINTKGVDFMNEQFRVNAARIVAYEFGRIKNMTVEYKMERKSTGVDGVKFPYENYTNLDINYIYEFNKMEKGKKISPLSTIADMYCDGNGGYYVANGPIDYLSYGTKTYEENWGLDKAFNPLKEDDAKYKELFDMFKDDEPQFIGRMLMPMVNSSRCSVELHKVYVVRCVNNGTTYFVSDSKEALMPFCY